MGMEGVRWPSSTGGGSSSAGRLRVESRKRFSKQREIMYRSAEQMKRQKSTDIRTCALSGSQEMNAEGEAGGKPESLQDA